MTDVIYSPTGEILQPATLLRGYGAGRLTEKILRNSTGTQFYCREGDYQSSNFQSVLAHRGRHADPAKDKRKNRTVSQENPMDMIRAQIAGLLEAVDAVENAPAPEPTALESALAAEKDRRRAAERKLAALKRALA